jgi:hypothetical protein
MAVAVGAEQFEVAELVAAAVAERDPMVDLEAAVGAAAEADDVTFVDTAADLAPCPVVADLASCLPVVTPSGALLTATPVSGDGPTIKAGTA